MINPNKIAGRAPAQAEPLRVLHLANHGGPVELPGGTPGRRSCKLSLQRIDALKESVIHVDAVDVVMIDWAGRLSDESITAVRALAERIPILFVGDDTEGGIDEVLMDAGASEWVARAELTPYWLERTLRRLHTEAVARSDAAQRGHDETVFAQNESAAHFRTVLERTPIILARLDCELRYQWVYSSIDAIQPDRLVGRLIGADAPSAATDRMRAWAAEVVRTGKGIRAINRDVQSDSGVIVYDMTLEPTLGDNGEVVGLNLAALDVTPTHRLQKALHSSERRYRTLVQSTSVGVFRMAVGSGHVVEKAPTWERFSGQRWPDYAEGGWLDCVHPDDRSSVEFAVRTSLGSNLMQRAEARFREAERQVWRWCEIRIVPIADDDGGVSEWVCTVRDVHDRKAAEQQVVRHAQELETLLDILPMAVFFAHDARAEKISGNRMATELTRMAPGANISLSSEEPDRPTHYHARINGHRAEPDELPMQRAVRGGVEVNGVEIEHVFDDGTVIVLFGNARPLYDEGGAVRGGVAVFADFSERRRLEEQLAASETRFAAFMENMPPQAYMKDVNGKFLYVNRAAALAANASSTELLGKTDSDVFPSLDTSVLRAHDLEVLESGRPGQFSELIQMADGLHHMLAVKFPMRTSTGERCVGGVSLDITEQERIREALATSEERLRLAIRSGALGMWEWDAGEAIVMSRRLCEFLGFETGAEEMAIPIEIIGERLHPDDAISAYAALLDLMAQRDGEFRRTMRVHAPGKEEHWIELVGHLHTLGSGPRMLGVAMDITEKKRAEEVIRRAQEELEREVDLRTRQLAVTNALLRREGEERLQAEIQLEEIRRLLTRSQEGERMRLAHELHDGPMQELATIGFELARAGRKLDNIPVAEELANIRQRLQDVNFVLRNFAGDLRPPLLDTFGLAAAISGLVEQVQERNPDLSFVVAVPEEEPEVDDEVSLAIYRVCQQAIYNIQRHAQAATVQVRLECTPARVELTVKDDGVGFAVPSAWVEMARTGHLGIVGMEERMRALGGDFMLESAPGQGTTLRAAVPGPSAAAPAAD